MKKIFTILFLVCLCTTLSAQALLDREIDQLVKSLTTEVGQKMKGKNIAITDFIGSDDKPSALGAYLAEEFSYALVKNAGSNFKVIDRSQLRKLLDEAGVGEKGMVDAQTVQKIDRLQGISAVVYGKLLPIGNEVRIFVKVIVLEELVNEITVRGTITRTPTIQGLLGVEQNTGGNNTVNPGTGGTSTTTTVSPFRHQHIQINLVGCTSTGSGLVSCDFQATSLGRDDNFSVYTTETVITDAQGRSYRAQSLSLNNDSPSKVQDTQSLQENTPVPLNVVFAGVPDNAKAFKQLALNCRSFSSYDFVARFANVTVN